LQTKAAFWTDETALFSSETVVNLCILSLPKPNSSTYK